MVATPLGNLGDITLRALDTLRGVDLVAAEDTRTTAISDPGALAVARVLDAGYRVTPIPGPNAAITALSAAGMVETAFLFYGFLPAKAGARRKVLESLCGLPHALVFYEAPHRIAECIDDLAESFEPGRTVVLARELTKMFESIHRCRLDQAQAWLAADDNNRRGEFVLIVSGAPEVEGALDAEAERVLALVSAELPPAKAAKLAAAITGVPRDVLYAHALARAGRRNDDDDDGV